MVKLGSNGATCSPNTPTSQAHLSYKAQEAVMLLFQFTDNLPLHCSTRRIKCVTTPKVGEQWLQGADLGDERLVGHAAPSCHLRNTDTDITVSCVWLFALLHTQGAHSPGELRDKGACGWHGWYQAEPKSPGHSAALQLRTHPS